jgi:hypothetical protein
MTIENALQRIHWRASSQQNYKPNPKDIEAVNFMVEWVNREKKQSIRKHQMFAKLYSTYLGELLLHYKDVDQAQKEINTILSAPIESSFFWFREKFNLVEHEKALKILKISNATYYMKSKDELQRENEILQDNQEYFLKHIQQWSLENITKSLENQITEAINRYDKLT